MTLEDEAVSCAREPVEGQREALIEVKPGRVDANVLVPRGAAGVLCSRVFLPDSLFAPLGSSHRGV